MDFEFFCVILSSTTGQEYSVYQADNTTPSKEEDKMTDTNLQPGVVVELTEEIKLPADICKAVENYQATRIRLAKKIEKYHRKKASAYDRLKRMPEIRKKPIAFTADVQVQLTSPISTAN